jgi:hypothetical protein
VRSEPAPAPAPPPAPAPTVVQFDPMADTAPLFPDFPAMDPADDDAPPAFMRRIADGNGHFSLDSGEAETADPFATPHVAPAADTAAKVNDLEREMARLLGEITAKRPS